MLTFLGILFLLIGLIAWGIQGLVPHPQAGEDRFGNAVTKNNGSINRFSKKMPKNAPLIILVFAVLFTALPQFFFYAEQGYQYSIVDRVFNRTTAVFTEGFKPIVPFSKVTAWPKFVDVGTPTDSRASSRKIEGVMNPIGMRFIDQVTADMYVSIRFQLPQDPKLFIELARKYRTIENLVYNTLIPTVQEQAINTGYMYTAQDYISGAAQGFRQTYDEMLKGGAYAVLKTEVRDTLYMGSIDQVDEDRKIRDIQIRYAVEKLLDENGMPVRVSHEITENNIMVSQVIVDRVVLDAEYQARLKEQKSESAQRQLEQQQIETAKVAQQRIIAEGERDKAQERVKQETAQVQQLISIETDLKRERTNKQLAEIQLQTERLNAEKVKVSASAEAQKNKLLVQAGLTPQEKAEIEKDVRIEMIKALAAIKYPQVMIVGQDGASGSPLESLIGAAMAKQVLGEVNVTASTKP